MPQELSDIPLRRIDGTSETLRDYAGDVVLVVNVASACGLTPQYASLESAFERERGRGLVILGFPCNQFAAQEPGTNAEIASFCKTKYDVEFPLFEKLDVNGPKRHPLYAALLAAAPVAVEPDDAFRTRLAGFGHKAAETDVLWNFEKFLISREGRVVGRFTPSMSVDDPQLLDAIDRELAVGAPA